jgi:hypothetical protein
MEELSEEMRGRLRELDFTHLPFRKLMIQAETSTDGYENAVAVARLQYEVEEMQKWVFSRHCCLTA